MENKEIRVIQPKVEIRKLEDGKEVIEGYGIVFNEWSVNLGGFIERILPESVKDIDWNNTIGAKNHSSNHILGRVPKTMSISVDEKGVRYSIDPPDTTNGRDTLEEIRRGDIQGSSFVFTTAKGGDLWEEPEERGGLYKRTVTKFNSITEMGPVIGEAYPQTDTTIAKRNLGLIKDNKEKEANELIEKQQRDDLFKQIQHEQTGKQLEIIKLKFNIKDDIQ